MQLETQKKESRLELIQLNLSNLDECVELDEITLQGLWSRNQWEQELTNNSRINLGFSISEKLISFGCGLIILDEVHLTSIAVHPYHRNRGIGTTLMKNIIVHAKGRGAKIAILEVKANNKNAISIYRRLGFKTIGLRKKYYKDGTNALIKRLEFTS